MEKVSKKPLRILQIGMHDKIGGVETYLMNYYRNIDKEKIQFDFISIYPKLCFEEEIENLGGRIYHLPSEKRKPIEYLKRLTTIMKNYNIIHINMLSAANILPIIAAKRANVEHIIVHSHNSNTPSGLLRKILDKVNRKYLQKNATDYWACSKLAGKWLFGDKICKSKKFKLVPNAVNYKKFKFNDNTRKIARKNLKVENKFVIGHIGRFSYQKNHEFLINIFYEYQKKNSNCVLLLIGDGDLRKKIQRIVENLKIDEKVIFLGTTNKIEYYLNAMDIFVLPSRFEGLPVTGIEAQMNGLKCLFSSNITNEVAITNNVVFVNNNVNDWINELEKKSEHKLINQKEINNSYFINVATEKLEKLYLKI